MPLDYEKLMQTSFQSVRQSYGERDTILYALGVGAGQDPSSDPSELRFVFEQGLQALPTMAVVLGYSGFWQKEPQYGLTWQKILHAEQSVQWHRPVPPAATVRGEMEIEAIYDKGAEKGALLYSRRRIFDEQTGVHLATVRQGSFLRADGGFGGTGADAPRPAQIPDRTPDAVITLKTRPEQATLYRLSGDYNPLHIDPAVAKAGGFDRPILHGLCTFGFAGRALLKALCDDEPAWLRRLDARFSSPVFPGETLRTEIWLSGAGSAHYRTIAEERSRTVIDNGYAEYDT